MAGLLYKDYVAVKGKVYIRSILAIFLVIVVLRLLLPPSEVDIMVMSLWLTSVIILYMVILGKLEVSLVSVDEGRRNKQYYLSLPVGKKQYVASKYIFVLLAFYITLFFGTVAGQMCLVHCQDDTTNNIINQCMGLLPLLACSFLIVPAIELPFFIGFGSKKGSRIKTAIFFIVFFAVIVYMLFGDLSIVDKISLVAIINYCKKHQELVFVLDVVAPYLTFGFYYLSYRISCLLFERKEWEDD